MSHMNPQKISLPGRICASLFEALDALWTAINSVPKLRDRLAGKLS
jgi:hypothetical protein